MPEGKEENGKSLIKIHKYIWVDCRRLRSKQECFLSSRSYHTILMIIIIIQAAVET